MTETINALTLLIAATTGLGAMVFLLFVAWLVYRKGKPEGETEKAINWRGVLGSLLTAAGKALLGNPVNHSKIPALKNAQKSK